MNYFNYTRRHTTSVKVGNITIGGDAPIRIQSMANTDTNDITTSAEQAKRIVDAGGELVRFTTQGVREVQSLAVTHNQLRQQGYNVPLVADIHFNANVANEAAQHVEKVRINPGNYVAGKQGDYTDEEFDAELAKIREKLHTFIELCKQHHTAIRIGVNHGSLSPRIMNRYGDTPEGLAASCMEFLHLCEAENFHDIVLSVKASNVRVMVQAVRLLVHEMDKVNMHYPLHLGVTEAGEGEDGRIKSAVGIGTLLADGIGDTIRVSLSEAPECEIPVARQLVDYIAQRAGHEAINATAATSFNPFQYAQRKSAAIGNIGGANKPIVVAESQESLTPKPDFTPNELANSCRLTYADLTQEKIAQLKQHPQVVILHSEHQNPIGEMRAFFHTLLNAECTVPVIIEREYGEQSLEALQLKAAADLGPLFIDGFGDGLWLKNRSTVITAQEVNSIAFGILQAARVRTTRTEYISCPSCGRTMFDLQTTVAEIKRATAHLSNLKIAVMGCIVNGPGEMADADYGYVGAGKGRVSLYRGKECIERNIPAEEAVERLLALIKNDQNLDSQSLFLRFKARNVEFK